MPDKQPDSLVTAPIRLLLTDVDGTLVGHDMTVSPGVRRALNDVRTRGVKIALCTGRPLAFTRALIDDLNLDGFHILDNGATIADPRTNVTLFHQGLETVVVRQVVDYALQQDVYLELYTDSAYYAERPTEQSRTHTALQENAPIFGDLRQVVTQYPITKMESLALNAAEKQKIQDMLDHFANEVDYGWAIVPGMTASFINIMAKGISKGEAVQRLVKHLGIPVKQVMGIGDGPNDKPMLRATGLGVAMGNAADTLKAVADWVTTSIDEDGLAVAIDRFILSNGV